MITGSAFPVEKVISAKIRLGRIVPDSFDVLVDPSGSALKILVEVG